MEKKWSGHNASSLLWYPCECLCWAMTMIPVLPVLYWSYLFDGFDECDSFSSSRRTKDQIWCRAWGSIGDVIHCSLLFFIKIAIIIGPEQRCFVKESPCYLVRVWMPPEIGRYKILANANSISFVVKSPLRLAHFHDDHRISCYIHNYSLHFHPFLVSINVMFFPACSVRAWLAT